MANVHAGYRVPPLELDEIPMDNYNSISPSHGAVQNIRSTGEYQRRLDARNCWNSMVEHRLAVVIGVAITAIIISFIAITTYLMISPGKSYETVEINKIVEVGYQTTEKAPFRATARFGKEIPVFRVNGEFSDDMLDALYKEAYKILPENHVLRTKRQAVVENIESCREKHENCKILLHKVKEMTRNVSQQVHELQKMINRIGLLNAELPSLQNVSVLDFATCLKCEKLENQTASTNFSETSLQTDAPSLSLTENDQPQEMPSQTVEPFEKIMNQSRESISNSSSMNESDTLQVIKNVTIAMIPFEKNQAPDTRTDPADGNSPDTKTVDSVPEVTGRHFVRPYVNSVELDRAEAIQEEINRLEEDILENNEEDENDFYFRESQAGRNSGSPVIEEQSTLGRSSQGKSVEPNPFIIPTAETTKTSQQLTYTPNLSWMPYPLCVYGPPNSQPQTVRQSTSERIIFPVSSPSSSGQEVQHANGHSYSDYSKFLQPVIPMQPVMQQFGQQQGIQYVPVQFGAQPASLPFQRFGPTGPGTQYFPVIQGNHQPTATGQGKPFYCTYLPTPTFQFPVIPGVSEFQRSVPEPDPANENIDEAELKSRDYAAGCSPNTRACSDRSRCIPKSRWCDGEVDCSDASDETRCSCRDRVDRDRLCDGYFDCPLGEDELGCFGCDKHSFSCDDSETHVRWGNCVPLVQRCDGHPQCSNGKDELNCNIITHSVEEREMFTVGYTKGFLHRNWKGKWYPVCTATNKWANDACRAEIGDESYNELATVESVFLQQKYNGPYVVHLPSNEIQIVSSCSNKAVFVNCPKMLCGTRVSSQYDDPIYNHPYSERYPSDGMMQIVTNTLDNYKSGNMKSKDNMDSGTNLLGNLSTIALNENVSVSNLTNGNDTIIGAPRVVGGRPSQPNAWPSLAAINKNGNFHCGGVILDDVWILTAAHCIDGYQQNYYDIQAGMLRRFSYSPMEQSRKVSHVVMYPSYDRKVMKNDLALLRLESPLYFNRWVRPACLPEITTAGPYWRTGPPPETTCVSAGWGSIVEHGPDPDHLREVELPILANCKYLEDQNEAEICAGTLQGGRDTCQGDSGGPLMCRNPNSPSQWYVAGIVSHGEGCARPNEPGAYTKVSRFVDWINDVRFRRELPIRGPLTRCPGYYCHSGSRKCYSARKRCDKSVDCIDAEDEYNCRRFTDSSLFRNADSENVTMEVPTKETDSIRTEVSIVESSTTGPTAGDASSTLANSDPSTVMPTMQPTTIPPAEVTEEITTTVQTDREPSTTVPTREQNDVPKHPPAHFSCKTLIQTIDIKKRCDRVVDCQDGSDENDCTCKDYLGRINPSSICDGHIDCFDATDEENCAICSPEEFHCKRSGECVAMSKRCDRIGDCEFNEDELGCLTLTNGKYVNTDIDGIPHHNVEGILTNYENGKWVPFCIDKRPNRPATLGKQMCSYFGFVGCESFNETRMSSAPLEVRTSTATNAVPYEYRTLHSLATDDESRCTALYLRCLPTIHTVALAYRLKALTTGEDDTFLWPWHAGIFVDGRYKCSSVLLEPSWLLTNSHCVDDVNLTQNYTTALLGASRSYLQVDGPHQQMSTVDEIKSVKNSDAVLLHLRYPANMTRHVQPMYLQKRTHAPAESDTCATVGVDKDNVPRTIFLKAVLHNCPDDHRCYMNTRPKKCQNETMLPWSGTVVCYGCSGWYPAAVYHVDDGPCSFETKQSLSSIDYINTNLITGMQEPVQPVSSEPQCYGFRCSLGECIQWKKVCDGVPHCRDGADEDSHYCQELRDQCDNAVDDTTGCHCTQSEMRCTNGQCLPKAAFCDGVVDCKDGSDEPTNCTCAAYLKVTAPELICDGRRHCLDKTDENSESCLCKDASFRCDQNTDECIPQDYVCDDQRDCSTGEDEKHCESLRTPPLKTPGFGELMERSYGVWHSRCFPAGALSENEGTDLCTGLGYSVAKTVTEISISDDSNHPVVPVLDKFYMVRLNRKTWIVMRDDKPLVTLHRPNETCYRHYVTCG